MPTLVFWSGMGGALLLGVTWIGYPAAIYLLSFFYRRPRSGEKGTPTVSVVLATRDDPTLIRRRVRHLLRTDYPPEKLDIVVTLDAGSRYEPSDLMDLTAYGEIRVVKRNGPFGKAPALNAGIESASGEILVFADTHQRFAPETIPELVSAFSDPRVGAASGKLLLPRRRRGASAGDLYWRFERWLRSREARIHSPVGVTGAVSAVRSSLWKPLPAGLILDDVYTPMRVVLEGHRIAFVESAVAFETRRLTPIEEYRRKTRTLTGVIQLCVWLPAVVVPWRNPIFLQFVLHKLFRLLTPYAAALVVLWGVLSLAVLLPTLVLPLALFVGGFLLWVGLSATDTARTLRTILLEVLLTLIAVTRAAANAVRGKWDVWD